MTEQKISFPKTLKKLRLRIRLQTRVQPKKGNRGISEDTLQAIEAKDKATRKYIADSIAMDSARRKTRKKQIALERALKSEIQNSSIYVPFALSEFGPEEPGSETEKLLKALKSNKGSTRVAAMMALGEMREKAAVDPILGILTRDYPPAQSQCSHCTWKDWGRKGSRNSKKRNERWR